MKQYLWNFSFEELFLEENGQETLDQATDQERAVIKELKQYYEHTASKCRREIECVDKQGIAEAIPELLRFDVVLQLCLIYSLGIQENFFVSKELIMQIEKEAANYFYEYRCFGQPYRFEQFSIMNQIALVN